MPISGFTLVRNAIKLDYPFRESVESVLPLCEEFVINCGDSDDETWQVCEELQAKHPAKIQLIRSVWERDNQQGGYQLKSQTDLALSMCRKPWCFYIQADEVVHEEDLPGIVASLEQADRRPEVDGLVFDYLHFYGSYSYIIKGRNWYRREVRLFKNSRGIEAFRDAQGFRRAGNRLRVLPAHARVFHYGYVRTAASLRQKSIEMAQWWGQKPITDPAFLEPQRHVGIRSFTSSHPRVMAERLKLNPCYDPKKSPRRWDKNEIKNALTLAWEALVPFRFGEFRNYDRV